MRKAPLAQNPHTNSLLVFKASLLFHCLRKGEKKNHLNCAHQLDAYFHIICYYPIYTGPVSNFQQRKRRSGKGHDISVILEDIISVFIILFFISLSISRLSVYNFCIAAYSKSQYNPRFESNRLINVQYRWTGRGPHPPQSVAGAHR